MNWYCNGTILVEPLLDQQGENLANSPIELRMDQTDSLTDEGRLKYNRRPM